MNLENNRNRDSTYRNSEPSFFMKIRSTLLLSSKLFSLSYKSSKLWQGYFIFFIGSGLLSLVLSTSTYPIFMSLFPHYNILFNLFGSNIWISFSPEFMMLSLLIFGGLLLGISFLISYFKKLNIKRTISTLGFSATPLLILIFYFLNKFLLQSFRYELGPLLIGIGLGWSGLSAFIGIINLIGVNFGGLFNYSIKSILFRRKRTYAAIIGIAVAVGLIVTPIPIISGYYTQLNSLAQQNQYSQFLIALEKGKSNFYVSRINLTAISSLYQENVQAVSPETYLSANISYNEVLHQISIRGINYTIFQNFRNPSPFQILPGKSFSENQLLIGIQLGLMLNISYEDLPINISLQYNSEILNITIIGLIRTNIQYDYELFAPTSLSYFLEPELNGKVSLVEIKLANPSLVDTTISLLQSVNPLLDIKRENNLRDFVSEIISRTIQSIWLLTFVIYTVMAFGMFHVMQTITKESEREIAILKSIGSNNFQVIRIFLYQAILLCLLGSVLGVLCGVLLSYLASILVSSITTITVQPAFDILSISLAIVLGVSSGVVGGLYPAYSSSKMIIGVKVRI